VQLNGLFNYNVDYLMDCIVTIFIFNGLNLIDVY
jgi:hypothetical protein